MSSLTQVLSPSRLYCAFRDSSSANAGALRPRHRAPARAMLRILRFFMLTKLSSLSDTFCARIHTLRSGVSWEDL